MKLTILTTFADFVGFRKPTQSLAAYSISLIKNAEVFVLGGDVGVKEICQTYDFKYISNVETGKDIGIDTNAIVLSDALKKAKSFISGDIILYTNGDSILIPNESFINLLEIIYEYSDKSFCGFECPYFLEFYSKFIKRDRHPSRSFETVKRRYKLEQGCRSTAGINLFLWTRDNFDKLQVPDFIVDGWRWDIWLGNNLYSLSEKVYLLSNIISIAHLDHPRVNNDEYTISTEHNRKLMGVGMGEMGLEKIPPEFDFEREERE